jgi:hypothetical protein
MFSFSSTDATRFPNGRHTLSTRMLDMIAPAELSRLLNAEESDTLERKASLSDPEKIRNAMIAFANDIAGRGGGKIIIGQEDNKTVAGLKVGNDEAQRRISDIARNRCRPSIPVDIEICEHEGKFLAIVDVKASAARPHCRGDWVVRQGSTNRVATDAEIMVLRSAVSNPKARQLLEWLHAGKTTFLCAPHPTGIHGRFVAELVQVKETYVVFGGPNQFTVPLDKLHLGFDPQNNRPIISYPMELV